MKQRLHIYVAKAHKHSVTMNTMRNTTDASVGLYNANELSAILRALKKIQMLLPVDWHILYNTKIQAC